MTASLASNSAPPHSTLVLPPLSAYVHIPWCVRKCPYCDFNSHESQNIDEEGYINKLALDLQQESLWLEEHKAQRPLHSIFFGGGTPSLFSPKGIGRIIQLLEKNIGFEKDIEITLEANPGTFEQEKFSGFFAAGVNRLSIGIQSFDAKQLTRLGRIHSGQEAQRAVHIAQRAGFTNINLDLMHGLPQQTVESAMQDLQMAIDFAPPHISWYQLTIEPNTVFYRQPPPLPVDDILADIQYAGIQKLAENGYQNYEISAYGQAGCHSRHNMNYWQFGDYIGIGAGAHGKLTSTTMGEIIRRQKTRQPDHYLGTPTEKLPTGSQLQPPKYAQHSIPQDELALEFMMNALRLTKGVPTDYFLKRTGLSLDTIEPALHNLSSKGLLSPYQDQICTTELGQRFLNTVLEIFSEQS